MRLVALLLAPLFVLAAAAPKQGGVPAGAAFRIEFDKPEYVLGENVLVHAILANEGTEPFHASFGGDYRALGRADRYKFTVTDENGAVLPDPLERQKGMNFGGFASSPTLKPGEQWIASLPLGDFVHFAKGGRYRVRVTHDFGWQAAAEPLPAGDAELTVQIPTAQGAEELVATAAAEKFRGGSVGQRSPPHASYEALYHPVFLPALKKRAEQLDAQAAEAIAEIETPDATSTLISLSSSRSRRRSALPRFAICTNGCARFVRLRMSSIGAVSLAARPRSHSVSGAGGRNSRSRLLRRRDAGWSTARRSNTKWQSSSSGTSAKHRMSLAFASGSSTR